MARDSALNQATPALIPIVTTATATTGATVRNHPAPCDNDSCDTHRSSGSGSGSDAMVGQSHPWQELKADEAGGNVERTTTNGSASGKAADDGIPIEMESVNTHTEHADDEAGRAGTMESGTATAAVVEYKVYKRRWFGLVQLTLLNIIVSWDVSTLRWTDVVSPVLCLLWKLPHGKECSVRNRLGPSGPGVQLTTPRCTLTAAQSHRHEKNKQRPRPDLAVHTHC